MPTTPTDDDLRAFYAEYPASYARCRTWKHGPERPYTVNRPHGPNGIIEVTRICSCGRLVTRTFTAAGQRIPAMTRVVYPTNPRYLALPGSGGVDSSVIALRAIEAEVCELDEGAGARRGSTRKGAAKGATKATSRKSPSSK